LRGLGREALAITARNAILRAIKGVLAALASVVTASGAVSRAVLRRFRHPTNIVSAVHRTIGSTPGNQFLGPADAVTAEPAICRTILRGLATFTIAVSASRKAVFRARSTVRSHLGEATDTVTAVAAVHRTIEVVIGICAIAIATHSETLECIAT